MSAPDRPLSEIAADLRMFVKECDEGYHHLDPALFVEAADRLERLAALVAS